MRPLGVEGDGVRCWSRLARPPWDLLGLFAWRATHNTPPSRSPPTRPPQVSTTGTVAAAPVEGIAAAASNKAGATTPAQNEHLAWLAQAGGGSSKASSGGGGGSGSEVTAVGSAGGDGGGEVCFIRSMEELVAAIEVRLNCAVGWRGGNWL